jgi:glycosyltransferase involved in cell wall biosynthesis
MPSSHQPLDAPPRLLLLSAAVPETRLAGALLLYRLLDRYPADRLLAVGPRPRAGSEVLPCEYRHLAPAPSGRFDLTRLAQLKRSLESIGLLGRIPMRRIDAAVGAFAADVVVSVMERRDYVDAAHRFCAARRLPLVLIVHDRVESFDLVYPPFRRAQIALNAATYRFASARLCVSPEMAASLEQIYGAPGTVLYPNRSEALTPRPVEDSLRLKAPGVLTLGYAGSLAYGYGHRIRQVMPALASHGVRLRIYSRDAIAEPIAGTEHRGGFPKTDELWACVKQECDAVWLPYSHDAHFEPLYRTHFPSKLTEYMALGMPVLISGPRYATGVRWGLAHPAAAVTIADDAFDDFRLAAGRLTNDASHRATLARESHGGDRDFDPIKIRELFMQVLAGVVHHPREAA